MDVTEFWNPELRTILNRNGWFQTVVDDPAHFKPTLAIFVRDKPDWVAMPEGLIVFETMPD